METIIAIKTLQAIKQALEADQGRTFRRLLRETMPQCEDAYKDDAFPFRSHLGASLLGEECARKLWYGFHWAVKPQHDARVLRLFNRGHLEEGRFVALLRMIGLTVYQHTSDGKQYEISDCGGHVGGSLDGVVDACPDSTGPLLCEFKTHDTKSFRKLAGENWDAWFAGKDIDPRGEGVRAAHFRHYVQMQKYMGHYGLAAGLYLAVCKDNDSIYAEIVPFDPTVFEAFSRRAAEIVFAGEPPRRIKDDPTWWQCKFCDYRKVCYGEAEPERNCRTCQSVMLHKTGGWSCGQGGTHLMNKHEQLSIGCNLYQIQRGFKP